MDNAALATAKLIEVGRAIAGEDAFLARAAQSQCEQIQACLSSGADVDVQVDILLHGLPGPHRIFALLVSRPDAAMLVVDRIQQPGADLPRLLARAAHLHKAGADRESYRHYIILAHACARKFAGLDWYQCAPTPPGSFYDFVPAAMLIEERAPGFNEALEAAQCAAGLPVGRQIEALEDREEALRDLVCVGPVQFWLGSTPRVDWMRRLMRDDIDPNFECDRGGVRLLEHILSNQPQMELVEEALRRGATVVPAAITTLGQRLATGRGYPEDAEILFQLVRAGYLAMDAGMEGHAGQTLRGYLQQTAPGVLARLDHDALANDTQTPPPARPGPRL